MIRFSCENCGHKMSVRDENAGKRGKCTKCGYFFVVPDKSTSIDFQCNNCGQRINVPVTYSGKKGSCPKCKNPIVVPAVKRPVYKPRQGDSVDTAPHLAGNDAGLTLLEAPEKLKSKGEPVVESDMNEAVVDEQSNEEDYTSHRRFPWPISLFLYPVSQGVLCTIIVIVILRILTDFVTVLLLSRVPVGGILGLIARVLFVYSYIYWYFSECIRDSAAGGSKAPEIIGNMSGLGDMVCQFLRLFACYAFFLGPVTFYRGYVFFSEIEANALVFWALLTYGIFFFPMGTLAVVMFGSVNGLNPVLIVRSIGSVLIRYFLLVVLVYSLTVMFIFLYARVMSVLPESGMIFRIISTYISFAFSIYALLIVGHLLGRFYYNYQERLNWEV
jgi:hypothetical protein